VSRVSEPSNVPSPPASRGFRFNGPTVVGLLYLLTYFTLFTPIVGVIMAYVWKRQDIAAWERTHYLYLIRTFWLGIGGYLACGALIGAAIAATELDGTNARAIDGAAMAAGVVATLFAVLLTVALLIRCVMAVVNAQQEVPMPKPASWTV
jgi:uncharacterized membrane protein